MLENMKGCKNQWHKKNCKENERCFRCGVPTCVANFPYHICVESDKKKNLKKSNKEFF